jgi:bisphosphoglycerate-dependent phosphoglycerate mutase
MPTAKIYFVRHGETDENRRGIIQGHLDTDLNAIGLEQSEVVAKELQSVPFDAGFSSDLKRAIKVLSFDVIWDIVDLIQAQRPQKSFLTIIQDYSFRNSLNCERG